LAYTQNFNTRLHVGKV